jgi:hypothetical protein
MLVQNQLVSLAAKLTAQPAPCYRARPHRHEQFAYGEMQLSRTLLERLHLQRTVPLTIALAALSWSRSVQAGPVEQLVDVAFGPGAEPVIVARYDNGGGGLIFGASRSWKLQCGSAFSSGGESNHGPMLVLSNGSVLVPIARGVAVGALDGCGYQPEVPLPGAAVIDMVPDPAEPDAVIAVCSISNPQGSTSSLVRRSPSGQWSSMGKSADSALATGMRAVLRNGHLRLYETALVPMQDDDAGPRYFVYKLRISDDGGQTFQERPLATDAPPRIVGVDPRDPERIAILLERSPGPQRIVVTEDQGKTLKPYLELEQLGGMAFAPDGRVWIGARSDREGGGAGIWAASSLAATPERLPMAEYAVQCLGYHAPSDSLYACQHFWLGAVDLPTGAFTTQLSLARVDAFATCDDSAARCEAQLCSAYCGPGHFAVAPVCSAYDTAS